MRGNIITFQRPLNYGAALQCTALYTVLSELGHEMQVIDYVPDYANNKDLQSESNPIQTKKDSRKLIRKGIKSVANVLVKPKNLRRKRMFDSFLKDNVDLTQPCTSLKELSNVLPSPDFTVTGSDQIWNANLTGGSFDPAYFASFFQSSVKKLAYGVSFGETKPREHKEKLCALTQGYSFISVREDSVIDELSQTIEKDVKQVLDPTLLLTQEDYGKFEKNVPSGSPYVLLYNVNNSTVSEKIACEIAKKYNLKVIDISSNPLHRVKGTEKHMDIGPGEFLSYVRHADFVITNSFHGSVFSVIYRRQFISVPHLKRPERVISLLSSLSLTSRIATTYEEGMSITAEIDYNSVNKILEQMRTACISMLNDAVKS